ncbi:uncharacterized protein VTP21DRAFT_7886 [Calcarisporiella thermophila]|uniref:uncharacterized protein n=1 Tax=Calcarisporiella thermophila TaxID=911321 RepID=UPI00374331A9
MDINGDKVILTWPDCPPLCRLCSSEGHDSRTCLLKERKRPQAPKTFVFDSISTTTAQQKNPPTNNGNPLVFGASSTEKSQTDADGFTLVTRRKGKRSKAGKKDQTQPEQEYPSTSASTPRPLKRQLRDFLPSPTTQSTNSEYNQDQQDIPKESELKETQPTQYEHLNNTHQEDNQYSPETDLDDPKTTHGDLGTTHGDTDIMHEDSA